MRFTDNVVVVTGGSKGFGKGLAGAFIKEGAQVVITSTNEAELKAAAKEIGAQYLVADASSIEDTKSLANYAQDKFGRIDIWANNAGVQIAPTNVEEISVDKLHRLFDVNFFGYFYGCTAALKAMKEQGKGTIININSTAGLAGKPGLSAYVSSKFAIKGLSESIREEVKRSGIRIYQVFPGGMQTDIYHEKVPADIGDYMQIEYAVDKVMNNLKLDVPELDLVIKRPTV
ncbi:MAG TPA: SDR family oxidoreductase [Candidatus Limnocylindria bacterium]|nr:SDR family oxidoreductase [Candidatus Limnocylindria bacterium]